MYIISKFRDYYDSAATFGIDKSCVYKRVKLKSVKIDLPANHKVDHDAKFVLGFCGKFYPGIKTTEKIPETVVDICYSKEEYFEKHGPIQSRSLYWYRTKMTDENFWKPKSWTLLKKYFHEYKTPVFLITYDNGGEPSLSIPRLAYWQFYKVVPSAQAFQEIFMYLSGVLGTGQNPMVVISDKKMAEKKGFDDRSFKKDPGQKKRGKNK
ncbi:MAG TPA: hypothetical protein VMW10_11350 [Alphaproteobacteria bacterium]|nr:hypothetical protein [Alphaproteobacteria bacterium]